MNKLLNYIAFALLFCTSACSIRTIHKWEPVLPGKIRLYTIKEVLTGDRIKLASGQIVKYVGIRAPQAGEPFFEKSRKANEWLLSSGRIFLKFIDTDARDRGYRVYAYSPRREALCFVNEELLAFGYATFQDDGLQPDEREKFIEKERLAKSKKRGLWRFMGEH